MLLRSGKYTIV